MTLQTYLLESSLKSHLTRFWKLWEIRAPRIILKGELKIIRNLQAGKLAIPGLDKYASEEFESIAPVRGRGGKTHLKVLLKNGLTLGVFRGPYSRFIKTWESSKS